jgi:hypothetical protein
LNLNIEYLALELLKKGQATKDGDPPGGGALSAALVV